MCSRTWVECSVFLLFFFAVGGRFPFGETELDVDGGSSSLFMEVEEYAPWNLRTCSRTRWSVDGRRGPPPPRQLLGHRLERGWKTCGDCGPLLAYVSQRPKRLAQGPRWAKPWSSPGPGRVRPAPGNGQRCPSVIGPGYARPRLHPGPETHISHRPGLCPGPC